MIKNKKKDNTLIKRKNLILRMKKKGIKRSSQESISALDKHVKGNLDKLFEALREEMAVQGRKTLKKEDVENVLEKINKKESWEI